MLALPVALFLAAVLVGAMAYLHNRDIPFYYDDAAYMAAAQGIRDTGLFSLWQNSALRTYGYPLLLSGSLDVGEWLGFGPRTAIFFMQWAVFVTATAFACMTLFRFRRGRATAFALLACNPLLAMYQAEALTESLTISCTLLAAAAIARGARSNRLWATAAWLCFGALVASFAMEVRPSSLYLPIVYVLVAGGFLFTKFRGSPIAHFPRLVLVVGLIVTSLVIPLVPQIALNEQNYQKATPLPVFDVAGLQAREGVRLLRYATNVSTCGEAGVRFANTNDHPRDNELSLGQAVRYYTLDWPAGPESVVLHVFSGLDPRPFVTYQHDLGEGYERLLQALTVALVILAGVGASVALRRRQQIQSDIGLLAPARFLSAVTMAALATLAISAAEYRFGALLVVAISLLAAVAVTQQGPLLRRRWKRLSAGFLLSFALWIIISDLVLATSETWRVCVGAA